MKTYIGNRRNTRVSNGKSGVSKSAVSLRFYARPKRSLTCKHRRRTTLSKLRSGRHPICSMAPDQTGYQWSICYTLPQCNWTCRCRPYSPRTGIVVRRSQYGYTRTRYGRSRDRQYQPSRRLSRLDAARVRSRSRLCKRSLSHSSS